MLIDGNFVFVMLMTSDFEPQIPYDVLDLESGEFVASVDFSNFRLIKNGYLYQIGPDEEGFAVIKRYKIDPAVYGR